MLIERPFRMRERRGMVTPRVWVATFLLGAVVGCGNADEPGDGTIVEGAVEGVSSEEMVGQASPMSLEEAESLGIVDTTVSVGPPVGPDSQDIVTPLPPP